MSAKRRSVPGETPHEMVKACGFCTPHLTFSGGGKFEVLFLSFVYTRAKLILYFFSCIVLIVTFLADSIFRLHKISTFQLLFFDVDCRKFSFFSIFFQ